MLQGITATGYSALTGVRLRMTLRWRKDVVILRGGPRKPQCYVGRRSGCTGVVTPGQVRCAPAAHQFYFAGGHAEAGSADSLKGTAGGLSPGNE